MAKRKVCGSMRSKAVGWVTIVPLREVRRRVSACVKKGS